MAGADDDAASGEWPGFGGGEGRGQHGEQREEADENGGVNAFVVVKAKEGASPGWVATRSGGKNARRGDLKTDLPSERVFFQ